MTRAPIVRPHARPARPRERLHAARPRAARREFLTRAAPARRSSTSAATRSTPRSLPGNIEHFIGVAQVPIGARRAAAGQRRARPGRVLRPAGHRRGHARRVLQPRHEAAARGRRRRRRRSSTTACSARRRSCSTAPARRATFGEWLDEHFDEIKAAAEATTQLGQAAATSSSTRPAASSTRASTTRPATRPGQNLTGKATAGRVRSGSSTNYPGIEHFFLESNFATDKKTSQVNMLRTRGKRVVAEATIPDALLQQRHAAPSTRADVPRAPGLQPRRLHVRRQQQRRALGQRHHRDVHRHRPGRRQRRRVLGRVRLRRAARRTATTTTRSRSRR